MPVDQEVLLLGPAERHDVVEVLVPEQLQDALGLGAHGLLAAQQRRLVVERLTGHRDEHRRDAQRVAVRVLQDVRRAGDVPARVTAGLEGAAQATRGEAGAVRLALDQGLARELGERGAVADRIEEAVVLLGGQARHRVEDVCVVGRALRQRPVLHRRGDGVGHGRIELRALVDRRGDGLEHRLGQPQPHLGGGEDVGTEDLAWRLAWIEADGGRHVRLDVVDRRADGLHFRSIEFLSAERPRLLADVDRPTLGSFVPGLLRRRQRQIAQMTALQSQMILSCRFRTLGHYQQSGPRDRCRVATATRAAATMEAGARSSTDQPDRRTRSVFDHRPR